MAATPEFVSHDVVPILHSRDATTAPNRENPSAHLVGICGSGMIALASLLLDLRWTITGSDLQPAEPVVQWLRRRGASVQCSHDGRHVPEKTGVLVYSAAVPDGNPERETARRLKIPELSYSQMLGSLMRNRKGVCIAGTHGKSTTAAMTAAILQRGGCDPSACIGAELCDLGKGGWAGAGDLFVVESCEYRCSFLDLSPTFAAILNVEPDHFDCFRDREELGSAFGRFAAKVPAQGTLIVRGDCPAAVAAAAGSSAHVETFSIEPPRPPLRIWNDGLDSGVLPPAGRRRTTSSGRGKSNWLAADLRPTPEGVRFRVFRDEMLFAEFALRIPGRHNVLNALAALALCHRIGVETDEMQRGLAEFRGIRRRFEHVGSWRGIAVYDDYAHHPTEVRMTLETARERFGNRRLWCIFQPHQVSRTRALLAEFAESFQLADELLIAPVYAARETGGEEILTAARELASRSAAAGCRARFCRDLDRIVATLDDEARPGDIVLTLGAGDIHRVHHDLIRHFQEHLAS